MGYMETWIEKVEQVLMCVSMYVHMHAYICWLVLVQMWL